MITVSLPTASFSTVTGTGFSAAPAPTAAHKRNETNRHRFCIRTPPCEVCEFYSPAAETATLFDTVFVGESVYGPPVARGGGGESTIEVLPATNPETPVARQACARFPYCSPDKFQRELEFAWIAGPARRYARDGLDGVEDLTETRRGDIVIGGYKVGGVQDVKHLGAKFQRLRLRQAEFPDEGEVPGSKAGAR